MQHWRSLTQHAPKNSSWNQPKPASSSCVKVISGLWLNLSRNLLRSPLLIINFWGPIPDKGIHQTQQPTIEPLPESTSFNLKDENKTTKVHPENLAVCHWKLTISKGRSSSNHFSGAMLNFRGVYKVTPACWKYSLGRPPTQQKSPPGLNAWWEIPIKLHLPLLLGASIYISTNFQSDDSLFAILYQKYSDHNSNNNKQPTKPFWRSAHL